MPLITDPYPNFVNGETADADQVDARFLQLYSLLNGALDADNLTEAVAEVLGLSQTGAPRRGKFVKATEGTRTNVAYGALSDGPDIVSGIEVAANALALVSYQAIWKNTVSGAGRAALFVGGNQVKMVPAGGGLPAVQEALIGGSSTQFAPIATSGEGLLSATGGDVSTAHVATGQLLGMKTLDGGFAVVSRLPAGIYDFEVRFKASSGVVSAKERLFTVESRSFG